MDWNILYKCVVQQRSRIRDLFSLEGYDDSCLAALRHVKSIIHVILHFNYISLCFF